RSGGEEAYGIFVRWLLAPAAAGCGSTGMFAVRDALREAATRAPELVGTRGRLAVAEANARIARALRENCREEGAGTPCAAGLERYAKVCADSSDADEAQACRAITNKGPSNEVKETAKEPKDAKEA